MRRLTGISSRSRRRSLLVGSKSVYRFPRPVRGEVRFGAWVAHADHADTFWLRQAVLRTGHSAVSSTGAPMKCGPTPGTVAIIGSGRRNKCDRQSASYCGMTQRTLIVGSRGEPAYYYCAGYEGYAARPQGPRCRVWQSNLRESLNLGAAVAQAAWATSRESLEARHCLRPPRYQEA